MKALDQVIRGGPCVLLAWGAFSCLPADTRPPPATVLLDVSPNDASQKGVTTVDGWSISVDRFLVGIGDASVGDACISYSDAGYGRLLDGKRSDDQKLSLLFGLGQCELHFRTSPPASDMLLGTGVTEADAILLATKDVDPYVTQPAGVCVDLTATATRGTSVEHLHWSFRQRIQYRNCETPVDGKPTIPLDFPSNANLTYHIALMPDALLRDDKTASAALRFDAIASADTMFGDGDGNITLDELGKVSLDVARLVGPYGVPDPDPRVMSPIPTSLEDYVYLVLMPMIPQFREPILCQPTIGRRFD
jgi:hypothetical protein